MRSPNNSFSVLASERANANDANSVIGPNSQQGRIFELQVEHILAIPQVAESSTTYHGLFAGINARRKRRSVAFTPTTAPEAPA